MTHTTEMEESIESMNSLLEHIQYNQYSWKIREDLEISVSGIVETRRVAILSDLRQTLL